MCNNTKGRIADAVEELICSQPAGKITVQQVMELTQMNRQSFYYHYQDINDVLQRIVTRKFCIPLAFDPAEGVEDWCRRGLALLKENKVLAQRIIRELGDEKIYELARPVVWPQVDRLIPPRIGLDPEVRKTAVDTICHTILCTVSGLVSRKQPICLEDSMANLHAVLTLLEIRS